MTATETKTLIIGVKGFENQIGQNLVSAMCPEAWAKRFDIDEENETLMIVAVVRAMFQRYGFHRIQDYETFGNDEPQTLRHWHRAYLRRFENELPLWLQLAMRPARKRV